MEPFQGIDFPIRGKIQMAVHAEAVVDADHDHILRTAQVLSVHAGFIGRSCRESSTGSAGTKSSFAYAYGMPRY